MAKIWIYQALVNIVEMIFLDAVLYFQRGLVLALSYMHYYDKQYTTFHSIYIDI